MATSSDSTGGSCGQAVGTCDALDLLFVIDNSGSMQRGRLETTLGELAQAVGRLSHSQSFHVVFFSDQAYPMYFPDAVEGLQPATPDNKRRLVRWLSTVEMCLGGRLLDAVEMAAAMEPQVVYLLSDGDIRSERVIAELTRPNVFPFTIHTLGMGARGPADAQKLTAIATAHGGTYRPIAATPAAVRSAAVQPIPYHNRAPGKVWGSAVRAWE